MLYTVIASNLGFTHLKENQISHAFNKSSRAKDWTHPSENLWLISATDTTSCGDLRDIVRTIAPSANVFVTPFDGTYSYCLSKASLPEDWLRRSGLRV